MNESGRVTFGVETFINLLATAYFLQVYLRLEAQGLKMLIGLEEVDWRGKY